MGLKDMMGTETNQLQKDKETVSNVVSRSKENSVYQRLGREVKRQRGR